MNMSVDKYDQMRPGALDELATLKAAPADGDTQYRQPYDATADADARAAKVRAWYEANRETWWQRRRPQIFSYRDNSGVVADNFILRLIEVVEQGSKG